MLYLGRSVGAWSLGAFLDVAEQTGLIVPIGEWVMTEAFRQVKAWQGGPLANLRVAVNIADRQLRCGNFLDVVDRMIADSGVDRKYYFQKFT